MSLRRCHCVTCVTSHCLMQKLEGVGVRAGALVTNTGSSPDSFTSQLSGLRLHLISFRFTLLLYLKEILTVPPSEVLP